MAHPDRSPPPFALREPLPRPFALRDLYTRRLRLRAPCPADVAPWTAMLNEPAVAGFWHSYDEERVRLELAQARDDVTVLAIESLGIGEPDAEAAPAGALLGAIQYDEEPDPDYRHAGIDLFLGARWHGRGLGEEAIRAVVEHLIGPLGHHRLVIDPAAHNLRAIRTYERVGFRRVGLLRRYERGPDGTFHDGLLMELLAQDYRPAQDPPPKGPQASCALRSATEADVPLIVPLMVAFNQFEHISWDPVTGAEQLRRLVAAPELGWVSLVCLGASSQAPSVVGYAVVAYGFDLEFGGRDAILTEFYLAPEARGAGLGRWALAELLQRCREREVRALHLQVRPDNARARRLYQEAGFEESPRQFFSKLLPPPGADVHPVR